MLNFFKKSQVQRTQRKEIPEGLWEKCPSCSNLLYKKDLVENNMVCPKCGYHFVIRARDRINMLVDEGSFVEINGNMKSVDPLNFKDKKRYKDRIKENIHKTGMNDAVITGTASINGAGAAIGVLDFKFMGGSMGSVVGQKITELAEIAVKQALPLIIISASGGARMQESILSLMQMAKTSAAIKRLKSAGLLYISVLTHPTTGGVSASFAMLGDINIAEPRATIGFAGRRVIEQTIKQELPDDFQTSEFVQKHGMLDMIVQRKDMKNTLYNLITMLNHR